MTENKRYKISDIAYFLYSDICDGNKPLWNEEVVDLLNDQDSRIKETEQIIERLYVFFLKWFEEERGMNPHDFGLWWCSIGLGETTFEKL